jgi:hypothetical protein
VSAARIALYSGAALFAAVALGCRWEVSVSRTRRDAFPWFSLMIASCCGSAVAALLAGGVS